MNIIVARDTHESNILKWINNDVGLERRKDFKKFDGQYECNRYCWQ